MIGATKNLLYPSTMVDEGFLLAIRYEILKEQPTRGRHAVYYRVRVQVVKSNGKYELFEQTLDRKEPRLKPGHERYGTIHDLINGRGVFRNISFLQRGRTSRIIGERLHNAADFIVNYLKQCNRRLCIRLVLEELHAFVNALYRCLCIPHEPLNLLERFKNFVNFRVFRHGYLLIVLWKSLPTPYALRTRLVKFYERRYTTCIPNRARIFSRIYSNINL